MRKSNNFFEWALVLVLTSAVLLSFSGGGVFAQGASGEECGPNSIEINTASEEELQRIIHIGSSRAADIIVLRSEAPFQSLEELTKVKGIGPSRLADILEQGCAWVNDDLLDGQEEGEKENGGQNEGIEEDGDEGSDGSDGSGSTLVDIGSALQKAVAYLKAQTESPDRAIALIAAGESADVSFLRSFSGDAAIAYAKPMLAITAAGHDPRTFPSEDFVAKMKSFASDVQLGDPNLLNDDIWGILALLSAGASLDDPVVQHAKAFVLANQNTDGGWAWNVGGASDTNDTAAAIMALLEVGVSPTDSAIQKAVAYLKSAQNEDGGFPYDPQSPFGTDSDGNSDAWVIMAITKLGQDPLSWTKSPANPVVHLLSLQDEDGGFWWVAPGTSEWNNKGATADAVIALTGKSFPIQKLSPLPAAELEEGLSVAGSAPRPVPVAFESQPKPEALKEPVEQPAASVPLTSLPSAASQSAGENSFNQEALAAMAQELFVLEQRVRALQVLQEEMLAFAELEPSQERERAPEQTQKAVVLSDESLGAHLKAEAAGTEFANMLRNRGLLAILIVAAVGAGLFTIRTGRRRV